LERGAGGEVKESAMTPMVGAGFARPQQCLNQDLQD
jgi:hypothetical protein